MPKRKMRLSKGTIGWGIFIVISASFMQQLRNWLFDKLGDFFMTGSVKLCFVLLAISALIFALKRRLGLLRAGLILSIFGLAYLFSTWQPYFSERSHVLTYGFLGYLAMRDLVAKGKRFKFLNFFMALLFIVLISVSDEGFQYFLPYRVGDIRDVFTNVISGIFGLVLSTAILPDEK
ncbi:MAG: VanZ family protein [Candidatus Omnitrophota bacterium]